MKVIELIKRLQECPPDFKVEIEGCDCIGNACGVAIEQFTVLITRSIDDDTRNKLLYPSAVIIGEVDLSEEIEDAVN